MTLTEVAETKSILATLLTALSGTLSAATGAAASSLYYAIGDLSANADNLIRSGFWGADLVNVFSLSIAAGATIPTMEQVRIAMAAEAPQSVTAVALTNVAMQMSLAAEVSILSATTFVSRQAIDAALAALIAAFEPSIDYAADSGDSASFQTLIAAQAAAVADLNTRAISLPAVVSYAYGRAMTSHALAQRLYSDASRADEIVAMNGIIDPHFMPAAGVALSE